MISVYATLLISTCLVGCVTASIKIGAFKIKSFGEAKLSRPYVRDILAKVGANVKTSSMKQMDGVFFTPDSSTI